MRRQYLFSKNKKSPVEKNGSINERVNFIFKLFFLISLATCLYSVLSISFIVYGNVPGIVKVFLEKQLLMPLTIVTVLFSLRSKSGEVSAFIGFFILFLFNAYFVYIYSSFYESTVFVEVWKRYVAIAGHFLNQIMFGVNLLCMFLGLAMIGLGELNK